MKEKESWSRRYERATKYSDSRILECQLPQHVQGVQDFMLPFAVDRSTFSPPTSPFKSLAGVQPWQSWTSGAERWLWRPPARWCPVAWRSRAPWRRSCWPGRRPPWRREAPRRLETRNGRRGRHGADVTGRGGWCGFGEICDHLWMFF